MTHSTVPEGMTFSLSPVKSNRNLHRSRHGNRLNSYISSVPHIPSITTDFCHMQMKIDSATLQGINIWPVGTRACYGVLALSFRFYFSSRSFYTRILSYTGFFLRRLAGMETIPDS